MIRAARIFAPTSSFRLALIDTAVIVAVFALLAPGILLLDPLTFFFDEDGIARLAPLAAILLLTMYFCGLYEGKRLAGRIWLLQQLAFCAGVGLISQALISYIYDPWTLPRNLALYGLFACIIALFAWRVLRDELLSRLDGTGTVLILGSDETARRVARHIYNNTALRLEVAGCLTNDAEYLEARVLGGIADLPTVAARLRPDLIISGMADSPDRMPIAEMVDLRYSGYRIEEAGIACELICRHVSARDVRPSRMLFSTDFDAKDQSPAVFVTDILAAALLLAAGAPFALLYAAMLRLSDGKPVVISEISAGFEGRPFVSRRFRVGKSGAVASFARTLHLTEWPQLWNVLMRRMSMVGPRPRRLSIARELNSILPLSEYRENARPGITGWAEINLQPQEMTDAIAEIEYDLYYIRNQSTSLYTYILLRGLRAPV
jgi:lipopolysaccharide/colanic/teichoic acid biosynthesis glycosyltransferase